MIQEEERKMAVQLKGPLMPIRQPIKRVKARSITAKEKRFGAFSVLKQVSELFILYINR